MNSNKPLSASLWCVRFELKFEMILPFVLWEGSGNPGAVGLCYLVSILMAVINGIYENYLVTATIPNAIYLKSVWAGLIVALLNIGLLIFWSAQGLLGNPIGHYGVGLSGLTLALLIVGFRLISLLGDRVPIRNQQPE